MKNRKRYASSTISSDTFWPSFTDLISTFVLILFTLILLAFIQNIVKGNNLDFARKQLMDTEKKLEESKAEISQAENQLRLINDELADTKAEIEAGEIALKLSQEQIDEQSKIIAESNRELGDLRSKLEGVALLRVNVLQNVKQSVEKNLGKTNAQGEPLVSISQAGNIIINESLVFDFNSATIKPEGEALLEKLADAFKNVLDNSKVRRNIESIVIQGHTDSRGDEDTNRKLSAARSGAVTNYMFKVNPTLASKYGEYFSSSAYSEFRPLVLGTSEEAYAKNRRIEISIVVRDSEVQQIIDDYLEETKDLLEEN
ncbi:MAG: flagellar motor protein MotB [Clostridiales bacterium]|nr:MAG: flagellar motor protein MotB [Clostridiales bacterium]